MSPNVFGKAPLALNRSIISACRAGGQSYKNVDFSSAPHCCSDRSPVLILLSLFSSFNCYLLHLWLLWLRKKMYGTVHFTAGAMQWKWKDTV